MIVLDTNVLIRWTMDPDALSLAATRIIADSSEIIVSSMSIWEIAWKMQRGKLALPISAREFANRIMHVRNVHIAAVDTQTWLRNVELDWSHRDPADRTIVATADLRGCPLVTSDRRIRAFYEQARW